MKDSLVEGVEEWKKIERNRFVEGEGYLSTCLVEGVEEWIGRFKPYHNDVEGN